MGGWFVCNIVFMDALNVHPPYDYLAGALIPVDKPLNWTSFDVVNKLRYELKKSLGIKKIKVGHAGTLDPLATGLLLIATGKMTKKINEFMSQEKVYWGQMQLGATTPTYDREQAIDKEFATDHIDLPLIEKVKNHFLGEVEQKVPVYSAIKKKGKKLYEYARKGEEVEVPTRRVVIHELSILDYRKGSEQIDFRVRCSKGTYIRSLAHDFGAQLDSGAYLNDLRREKIGNFDIEDAFEMKDILSIIQEPNGIKE